MIDQTQTDTSSSSIAQETKIASIAQKTKLTSIINPNQGNPMTLLTHTQHRKESLATTIKNTMRLGIQEMTDTFSRALIARNEYDVNASYKISLGLVNFEKKLIETRKPLT